MAIVFLTFLLLFCVEYALSDLFHASSKNCHIVAKLNLPRKRRIPGRTCSGNGPHTAPNRHNMDELRADQECSDIREQIAGKGLSVS